MSAPPPPTKAASNGCGGGFGAAVARFDVAADHLLDPLRGHAPADGVFAVASHVGEFSIGWHVAGLAQAIASGRPRDALRLSALIGAESLVVNQGIKRLVRRPRPDSTDPELLGIRRPSTSSFPSGHASSAFFAATLLTAGAPPPWRRWVAPAWFGMATVVALSRAYTKVHHPSDVLAGAAVGLGLAQLATRWWPAGE